LATSLVRITVALPNIVFLRLGVQHSNCLSICTIWQEWLRNFSETNPPEESPVQQLYSGGTFVDQLRKILSRQTDDQ